MVEERDVRAALIAGRERIERRELPEPAPLAGDEARILVAPTG